MSSIVLTFLLPAVLAAPPQDATSVATELLEAGSASFDDKDAAAMAATFAEGAEIRLLVKGEDGFQEHSYSGKEQIRKFYADLFSNAGSIDSKNVVEYARFVGTDLLLIGGTFEPDLPGAMTLQFLQIRIREDDGSWLMRELTVIPIPQP